MTMIGKSISLFGKQISVSTMGSSSDDMEKQPLLGYYFTSTAGLFDDHHQGKPSTIQERTAEILPPDGVDTTLCLSTLSTNCDDVIKTLGCAPKNITTDDVKINLAAKFSKEIIDMNNFLELGIGCSRNYKTNDHNHKLLVLKPIPLRSYNPTYCCMHASCPHQDSDGSEYKGSFGNSGITTADQGCSTSTGKKKSPKRKRKDNANTAHDGNKKGKKKSRSNKEIYSEPYVELSPEFLQIIGTSPVFLYRKKLFTSDVNQNLNRLFITGTEKLLEFLTEEERKAVTDGNEPPGIDYIGVDRMGREYELRSKKWTSLGIIVVKGKWNKMVEANGVTKGYWVDLWGYRLENGKFCLAVNFSDGGSEEIDC